MIDALKTELKEGDKVAFIDTYLRTLVPGIVVGFTPKMIKILHTVKRYDRALNAQVLKEEVVTRPIDYVAKVG